LFEELPPHEVEITLYGASPEVYERITRVPGSFARCLEGIERLRRADIPLGLKTILMTWNREELPAIQETAGRLGLGFRFDAAISTCLDGTAEPLALRIDAAEAVTAEFADEKRRRAWLDFYHRSRKARATGELYECGAGLTGFHVDPFGNLQMCLMAPEPRYSLRDGGTFAEGWREAVPAARGRKASPDNPCVACDRRELCGYCPGLFKIETGNEERPSQFVCDMRTQRLEQILRSR
ncbi:MAG: hypothetical protein M1337_00770, partial [Actinobacteria bacterium]|nr:hypothetical protein [Actinomycetota bacterium]